MANNIMSGKVEEVKKADYTNEKGVHMAPVFLTVLVNDMSEELKDDSIVTMRIRIEEPTWKAAAMALLPGCFVKISCNSITKRGDLGYYFVSVNWLKAISKAEYCVPEITAMAVRPAANEML